ncbi:MAG: NAD(P)H-dependent flavin oxidoreductase [Caulobacteraceae bacterium]
MRTAATQTLGIDHPVIQAPMGGATSPALAAAVSEAGGLGMLALSWTPIEKAQEEIRATRALTSRPFGINLVLAFPQEERLEACLEAGARIVSFFWGRPGKLAEKVHAPGGLVIETVASAAEACEALHGGPDILVAQGWEAGGHVKGEVATLPLTRVVVEAARGVPVLAAGGVVDGAGLAAVLALGATGAWIGTRFLASREAAIHPDYQRRLIAATETSTVWSSLYDLGWPDAPHRTLRNSTFEAWEAAGRPPSGARPGEGEAVARLGDGRPLPRYAAVTPPPGANGEIEALSLWAGQGVGLVREIKGAGEIVAEIAAEAEATITVLARRLAQERGRG